MGLKAAKSSTKTARYYQHIQVSSLGYKVMGSLIYDI